MVFTPENTFKLIPIQHRIFQLNKKHYSPQLSCVRVLVWCYREQSISCRHISVEAEARYHQSKSRDQSIARYVNTNLNLKLVLKLIVLFLIKDCYLQGRYKTLILALYIQWIFKPWTTSLICILEYSKRGLYVSTTDNCAKFDILSYDLASEVAVRKRYIPRKVRKQQGALLYSS